jgi:hypothetical protein
MMTIGFAGLTFVALGRQGCTYIGFIVSIFVLD